MPDIPVDLIATKGKLTLPGTVAVGEAPAHEPVRGPKPSDTPKEQPSKEIKEAAAKTRAQEQKTEGTHPIACRHCGWLSTVEPAEPGPGDAQRFRDAVFSGKPYEKVVVLFDAFEVTFKDLTPNEEQLAQNLAVEAFKAEGLNREGLFDKLTELRVGAALVSAKVGTRAYTQDPKLAYQAQHDAFSEWCGSLTVYQAVRSAYVQFAAQMLVLMSRAANPSFFTATGQGGGSPASQQSQ